MSSSPRAIERRNYYNRDNRGHQDRSLVRREQSSARHDRSRDRSRDRERHVPSPAHHAPSPTRRDDFLPFDLSRCQHELNFEVRRAQMASIQNQWLMPEWLERVEMQIAHAECMDRAEATVERAKAKKAAELARQVRVDKQIADLSQKVKELFAERRVSMSGTDLCIEPPIAHRVRWICSSNRTVATWPVVQVIGAPLRTVVRVKSISTHDGEPEVMLVGFTPPDYTPEQRRAIAMRMRWRDEEKLGV